MLILVLQAWVEWIINLIRSNRKEAHHSDAPFSFMHALFFQPLVVFTKNIILCSAEPYPVTRFIDHIYSSLIG